MIREEQPTLQLDDDLFYTAANASLYETPKKLQHFLEIPKQQPFSFCQNSETPIHSRKVDWMVQKQETKLSSRGGVGKKEELDWMVRKKEIKKSVKGSISVLLVGMIKRKKDMLATCYPSYK